MTERDRLWVKICGVTRAIDAELAVEAGADALGLNFVPSSKRCIDLETAREIVAAVGGEVELIAVLKDPQIDAAEELRAALGLDWLQLHGSESPEFVSRLARSFKALGVATQPDVERASIYGGERLLVDAKVEGESGGTGQAFDWSLVSTLARARPLIVAGGLGPDNVARAVESLQPFGVDAASGLERAGEPRQKDPGKMRAFVQAARQAFKR